MIPSRVHGQQVMVIVVVVIIMRLPVPERAVGFLQPGCGEPVQGDIPEQKVPAQRVSSVHVQVMVRIPQGVPHRVREALFPCNRTEAHKWGHHSCPVQTTELFTAWMPITPTVVGIAARGPGGTLALAEELGGGASEVLWVCGASEGRAWFSLCSCLTLTSEFFLGFS